MIYLRKQFIKIILLFAIISILFNCAGVQVALNRHQKPDKIKKIAVFEIRGSLWKSTGSEVADLISTGLLEYGFDVIERTQLKKIIKEQQLGQTGLVDQDQAVQVGKIAGADSIIIGSGKTVYGQRNTLESLTIKIINVKTASVIVSAYITGKMKSRTASEKITKAIYKKIEEYKQNKK